MHDCCQEKRIEELVYRIIELEKSDIAIKGEIRALDRNVKDLQNNIDEVKSQMEAGFNRVSAIVFRAMAAIICILLTALGTLIYNYIINI